MNDFYTFSGRVRFIFKMNWLDIWRARVEVVGPRVFQNQPEPDPARIFILKIQSDWSDTDPSLALPGRVRLNCGPPEKSFSKS